jgi:hypothetical protein
MTNTVQHGLNIYIYIHIQIIVVIIIIMIIVWWSYYVYHHHHYYCHQHHCYYYNNYYYLIIPRRDWGSTKSNSTCTVSIQFTYVVWL